MDDKYLKVTEVASRYSVTPQAVYKWIDEGRLKAVRVGDAIRIKASDLENFEQPVEPKKKGK